MILFHLISIITIVAVTVRLTLSLCTETYDDDDSEDTDFILLKLYTEKPIYINPFQVLAITKDDSHTLVHMSSGIAFMVCEPIEEVLQEITINN